MVFKNEDKDHGLLVGTTTFSNHTSQLMARHYLENLQTREDKTKTQTLILHCMFQDLPVSPSTTKKWVPLIVTIFIAKAFCDSTWPGEQKHGKHGFS